MLLSKKKLIDINRSSLSYPYQYLKCCFHLPKLVGHVFQLWLWANKISIYMHIIEMTAPFLGFEKQQRLTIFNGSFFCFSSHHHQRKKEWQKLVPNVELHQPLSFCFHLQAINLFIFLITLLCMICKLVKVFTTQSFSSI